jgi:hypothetical protein
MAGAMATAAAERLAGTPVTPLFGRVHPAGPRENRFPGSKGRIRPLTSRRSSLRGRSGVRGASETLRR